MSRVQGSGFQVERVGFRVRAFSCKSRVQEFRVEMPLLGDPSSSSKSIFLSDPWISE